MPLFTVGFFAGFTLCAVAYHFRLVQEIRKVGDNWRARAISAEQEVENWKVWAKAKSLTRGY